MILLVLTVQAARASVPDDPDVSQCDNCDVFPAEFLEVDTSNLIDLDSLPPQRRLDFLIGEWELIFPAKIPEQGIHYTIDQPVGFEVIDWFNKDRVLSAFQEWPFTNQGKMPFRAKTDFRYIKDEDRWQMTWLTNATTGIYSGGLETNGVFSFYEHEITGSRRLVRFEEGARYLFRNITPNQFLAEWYESADGGKTFNILKWRLLYRRRVE